MEHGKSVSSELERAGTTSQQREAVRRPTIVVPPRKRVYPLKRVIDLAVSLALVILLAPLFAVLAVLIRASSPGPVFFRQQRLGLGERPFRIYKFRTMRADAEQVGPRFTSTNDPRITRIGALLRRTSLDELPQIFNVLFGDMSLLGPRPYVGFELENWTAEDRARRASVRPGISGLAQARGRSGLDPETSRRLDLEYVDNVSFSLDVRLVLETLRTVLARRGVN